MWICRLIALLSLNVAAASHAQQPRAADHVPAPEAIVEVDVSVDPRIELLLIVQHLTGDYEKRTRLITDFDFEYKREVEAHFRPFAMHTVVMTYRAMALKGFSFDAGPQCMLRLKADESLALRSPIPEDLLKRVGGAEQFETFRSQIADFAQASGFWTFFADHQPLYDELCRNVMETAKPGELVAALNGYTGMRVTNAHLVLFPMGHPGGFAAHVIPEVDGVKQPEEVFAVVGPGGVKDDKPVFGGESAPWFESLIIHEFAHTIVNPLADGHADRVAGSAAKLEPIRQQMSRQAYQNWRTVVNEHIVRAIECRLALHRHGADAGAAKLKREQQRSFIYVPGLTEALGRYEQDRAKWSTLEQFYPELLSVFERGESEVSASQPDP